MSFAALKRLGSAGALLAYLGLVLLAAPCTCTAKPVVPEAQACCCGPGAETPCAPGGESEGCEGHLGAGCAHALPEAATTEAAAAEQLLSAPAVVLEFALALHEAERFASTKARASATVSSTLAQVRSTVLLI